MVTGLQGAGSCATGAPRLADQWWFAGGCGPLGLAEIPRRGLWLDTGELTPEQAVEAILADGMRGARYG
jgi:hypothetical protein